MADLQVMLELLIISNEIKAAVACFAYFMVKSGCKNFSWEKSYKDFYVSKSVLTVILEVIAFVEGCG